MFFFQLAASFRSVATIYDRRWADFVLNSSAFCSFSSFHDLAIKDLTSRLPGAESVGVQIVARVASCVVSLRGKIHSRLPSQQNALAIRVSSMAN